MPIGRGPLRDYFVGLLLPGERKSSGAVGGANRAGAEDRLQRSQSIDQPRHAGLRPGQVNDDVREK